MESAALNHPSRLDADQRLRDLEALILVSNQINRSLDPDNVYATSLTGIQAVLHADFGCFVLLNPNSRALELGYSHNLIASLRARLEDFTRDFHFQTDLAFPEDRFPMLGTLGQRLNALLQEQAIPNSVLIPLVTSSQLIGMLLFGITESKLLAPKSIDLLMSIGDQVARAIENARLHTKLIEAEAWSRTFIESSPDAFWEGDPQGRILYINDAASKLIGLERSAILKMHARDFFVYDEQVWRAGIQEMKEKGFWTSPHIHFRIADGQIKDISFTSRAVRDSAGNLVGHQTIFRDVTAQERAREMLQQRNEELAALNSIAGILANPLEVEIALDQVCEKISSITGMETVSIYLVDESRQYINLLAQKGISENLLREVRRLGLDDPITYLTAVEGKPLAYDEVSEFPSPTSLAGPRREGYHAGIAAPIIKHGAPVGAIFVGSKIKNKFLQSDIDLIQNIGSQIGVALDNADLFARMQQRVRELEGLAQLGIACNETLDPLALAQVAVDSGHKLLGTDYVIITLLENNRMRLVAFIAPDGVELRKEMEADPVLLSLMQESDKLAVSDIEKSNLPELYRQNFLSTGMRSIVAIPMAARDHIIGAMAIAYQQPYAWQPHETDLLSAIAHQVASAIDSAQLFQKILSEQRKVQAIFDSGLSGLYVTDAAGHLVMFNTAAQRMTGWSIDELRDHTWNEIFRDPAQEPTVPSLIDDALSQKKTVFAQEGRKIRRRDGRIIPVAKAVAPLLDEQGNVTGAVGAFWDLSREEEAELEREDFLRLVAHQLRSPLTGLLSALELLEQSDLSKKQQTMMRDVVKSDAERLRRFASQFLKMESVVRAERQIDLTPIPINDLVMELVKKYDTDRTHPIHVRLSQPSVAAFANRDGLENVLCNLIDNAILYTPNGAPITISVSVVEPERVLVQVQDQGPGISAIEQTKIFRPFYRSPRELSTHATGHGLGLAIAQRLVKEMDGELAVTSEEGKGATFYFTLRECFEIDLI